MRHPGFYVIGLVLLAGLGCNRGYISADAMEAGEIGPRNCEESCREMGLRMGAFVLVQHSYAGCVCQPVATSGGTVVPGAAAAQAGAVIAVGEAQRRAQQQQQQQQQN